MDSRHSLGKKGEDFIARYLQKKGYQILDKNFHSRFGEIDIIAKTNNEIVFVEVKTRRGSIFGSGLEAIHTKKMRGLIKTAYIYLKKNNITLPMRFDACEVEFRNGGWEVEHLENITL